MKKKIYHGSIKVIEKPVFGYGNIHNDYGLGFYCTEDLELAKEWAVNEIQDGYANIYEIELEGLNILNLNQPEYCFLHWLALLLANRTFSIYFPLANEAKEYIIKNFLIDVSKYDVIIGYRADDSYFSFAKDFINGTISYQQLCMALKLGNLGEQFVLISKKAFDTLTFVGYEKALRNVYYPKKRERDLTARKEYFNDTLLKRNKNDLYIIQILNEEIGPDDPRL